MATATAGTMATAAGTSGDVVVGQEVGVDIGMCWRSHASQPNRGFCFESNRVALAYGTRSTKGDLKELPDQRIYQVCLL